MPVDLQEYHKRMMTFDKDYAAAPAWKQRAYLEHLFPQSASPAQQAYSKIAEPVTQAMSTGIAAVQPALQPIADVTSAGVEKLGGYPQGALRTPEAKAGGLQAAQTTGARQAAETVVPQTPEEAALTVAIPGAGKLGAMLRPGSKLVPALARIAASGAAGALDPRDPSLGFLKGAGLTAGVEAIPAIAGNIPAGKKLANLLRRATSEDPAAQGPALHQAASFRETGGGSVFDTATGKSIERPIERQPITFHRQSGDVSVKPPTGGVSTPGAPDVILQEALKRAPKPSKQGARTFSDWLANYTRAKREEETRD